MISQFCASVKDKDEFFLFLSKASREKQSHMGVEDRMNQRLRDVKKCKGGVSALAFIIGLCVFVYDMGLDLSLALQLLLGPNGNGIFRVEGDTREQENTDIHYMGSN